MNPQDSWRTRTRRRLAWLLQTKRLAIFSGASLVVALTSIGGFAALLDTIGDERELVDILERRSVRLEAARRILGSGRAASAQLKRQLGVVLDSTLADLTKVEGSLATRKSTKLAALSQLRAQIGLLRDKVSEA